MSKVELVSTGSSGLDLVLGGGLALLDRGGDCASGSLLIRGGAGAGKTILALQLASHLAKHRGGDVAYGCVELLPVELAAQHRSVFGEDETVGVVAVVPASASASEPFGNAADRADVSILAAVLDLGATSAEHEHLGAAIQALLDGCKASGSKPTVLVIDSLVGSYGLGAATPRAVIDGLVKLAAQRGLFLIVAEESGTDAGEWRFAVDTVIELQHGPAGPSRISERDLFVTKHRFAASEVGPHSYLVGRHGVACAPTITSYFRARTQLAIGNSEQSGEWGYQPLSTNASWAGLPADGASLVYGPHPRLVRLFAMRLVPAERTYWLDFGVGQPTSRKVLHPGVRLDLGNPEVRPERLLASCREGLERNPETQRVVAGDLAALSGYRDPSGMRRATQALTELVRSRGVPVVLFATLPDPYPMGMLGWPDFSFRVDWRNSSPRSVGVSAWARDGAEHSFVIGGPELDRLEGRLV